ncbi:HNH endonuclease [Nonomuraea sp. NN258]|nr:HNH endonuclease [Nonomuraea antri]
MCKPCYRRDYYVRNGERERANFKAWRERNIEHERQRWIAWHAANRDALATHKRELYAADPEGDRNRVAEWRKRNPGSHRRWREANPEKWALLNRANQRRRRSGDKVDYSKILERDGWVCHICGYPIDGLDDLHFDHVIPLIKGGPHSLTNIRPAHAKCNLRKGAKLLEELALV